MTITVPADAPFYINTMVQDINRELNRIVLNPARPTRLASFDTLADFPNPAEYPQCIALALDTQLIHKSDGVVWSAV